MFRKRRLFVLFLVPFSECCDRIVKWIVAVFVLILPRATYRINTSSSLNTKYLKHFMCIQLISKLPAHEIPTLTTVIPKAHL
jgi:hypothetical protein